MLFNPVYENSISNNDEKAQIIFFITLIMSKKQNINCHKNQKYKYQDPPQGKRADVYKDLSRQEIIDENIYLRWKNEGLKVFNENLEDARQALYERFELYHKSIYDIYLSPEILKLNEKIKQLTDENNNLKETNTYNKEIEDKLQTCENLKTELQIYKNRCEELTELNDELRKYINEFDKNNSRKTNARRISELETANNNLIIKYNNLALMYDSLQIKNVKNIVITVLCCLIIIVFYKIIMM